MGYVRGWQSDDIRDLANGKWPGILQSLGVPREFLRNRHQACPMCGGEDRFRFDNKDGRGTYICGQCGSGDGWHLLMKYNGWDFKEAAKRVRGIVGGVTESAFGKREDPEELHRRRVKLWESGKPIEKGDLADIYFHSRGIGELIYPKSLRFSEKVYHHETRSEHPAILAAVQGPDKMLATVHKTYLADDGKGKIAGVSSRLLASGEFPEGSAVRLSRPGPVLGIAEGIETAMSASAIYQIPVWAALNTAKLQAWLPPEGVEEVVIFGDHDKNFSGQAAAYVLAKKLCAKGLEVGVKLPQLPGTDFNDEYRTAKP